MPNVLLTAVGIEFVKLISRAKNRILLAMIMIISLAASVFSSGGLAVKIAGMSLNFYNGAFLILTILNNVLLPMIVFTMSADTISHEFSDKTIKAGLLRPISKLHLFLAKWAAVVLFGICCLGASFISGGITSIILKQIDFFSAFTAYAVSIAPLCVFAAMSSLISAAVSGSAMSMFLSLLAYLFLNATSLVSSSLSVIFFTAHVNWFKMFLSSFSSLPVSNIINISIMMTAYTVLFLILGNIAFSAKKV